MSNDTNQSNLINQLSNESENLEHKITDTNTTSVDIKTMVEEEISASNGD